jgi:molybdenum cofactor cytidylyltransferase
MAPLNKLLIADPSGTPMIARVVDHVLASHARPVIVVTGHQRERVEEALGAAAAEWGRRLAILAP